MLVSIVGVIQRHRRPELDIEWTTAVGNYLLYPSAPGKFNRRLLMELCYKRRVTGRATTLGGGFNLSRAPSRGSGRMCISGKDARNRSKDSFPPFTLTLDRYITTDTDEQGWWESFAPGSSRSIPHLARAGKLCQGRVTRGAAFKTSTGEVLYVARSIPKK